MSHSRIISTSEQGQILEPDQLDALEQAFKDWAAKAGKGRFFSRRRILVIFLLIRYTGAKLNEVLGLDAAKDFNLAQRLIRYRSSEGDEEESREVHISHKLAEDVNDFFQLAARESEGRQAGKAEIEVNRPFSIDPAFVRRKFYERAEECGLDPKRSGPEMIRKARALELMSNNMPLPVVQRLLGHSSLNLTASGLTFSEEEMRQVARWFMERESSRKTSARNSFFGKVQSLAKGEVQSLVEIVTPEGNSIRTMVTNSSAERLGLKPGRLASAEIKAPWLVVEPAARPGVSSADNVCEGVITELVRGEVNVECEIEIREGMKLCAIVSAPGFDSLGLNVGDRARALFTCYAVVLHVD